jgi:hypothetical protein
MGGPFLTFFSGNCGAKFSKNCKKEPDHYENKPRVVGAVKKFAVCRGDISNAQEAYCKHLSE